MAGPQNRPHDVNLVLSACAAIFAGLVGTGVLDIGNAGHYWGWADHAVIVLWIPAIFLLAMCAYKAPTASRRLRTLAGITTGIAASATVIMLVLTGFGFTRDKDHVLLLLNKRAVHTLKRLCGPNVKAGHIEGHIRTRTLQEEFVIFDFDKTPHTRCATHSVDIPRADVLGFVEQPAS